ncbi:MAG: hypothetical protein ABFQ64_06770 [Campylobacterota bacterium]
MIELQLPHQAPIRFAKYIVSKDDTTAVVKVKFETIPTLPMIVESAAQSSAAFSDGKNKNGFLVTLKNIKLLEKLNHLEYDIKVSLEYEFEGFSYFNFEINSERGLLSSGKFMISIG